MIVVTGHIKLKPEQIEALRPAMRTVLEATRAEDGCILYAYGEDVIEPGTIRIVERWRDWDALSAHGAAPHIAAWQAAIRSAGGAIERDIVAHEAGTSRVL